MPEKLLVEILIKHGIWALLFFVMLFVFHAWIARIHKGRLDDRQREIDRLAADNHEYRELFARLLRDKMLGKTNGENP